MFYTMEYDSLKSFQIRSKGKPHKRTMLKEVKQSDPFTVYTENGEHMTNAMTHMLKKAKQLYTSFEAKNLYISVNNNTLYLAYESKTIPKRQHKRDCEQFERLYNQFLTMIKGVDVVKADDIFEFYSQ
ncbi:MAG: hypothetical protein ACOC1L_03360 [Bacillota bacterium]